MENGVLASRAGTRRATAIPRLNRTPSRAWGRAEVDRSHRVYATRRDVRFTEMEYAVPRGHGAEALRRVLETIERRGLPVACPIEMRFVRGDDAPRSAAHARTGYIAVHMFRGKESRPTSARSRRSWTSTAAGRAGQAPLPVGGHAEGALPAGTMAGGARAAGSRAGCSRTTTGGDPPGAGGLEERLPLAAVGGHLAHHGVPLTSSRESDRSDSFARLGVAEVHAVAQRQVAARRRAPASVPRPRPPARPASGPGGARAWVAAPCPRPPTPGSRRPARRRAGRRPAHHGQREHRGGSQLERRVVVEQGGGKEA